MSEGNREPGTDENPPTEFFNPKFIDIKKSDMDIFCISTGNQESRNSTPVLSTVYTKDTEKRLMTDDSFTW